MAGGLAVTPEAQRIKAAETDVKAVDAGWIIASHSNGDFVPIEDCRNLERQRNEAREERDVAVALVAKLRDALEQSSTLNKNVFDDAPPELLLCYPEYKSVIKLARETLDAMQ